MEGPIDEDQDGEAEQESDDRREHDEHRDLLKAGGDQGMPPRAPYGGPSHPPDQGVRRARGQAEVPGDHVPYDGSHQSGEDDRVCEDPLIDHILGDRAGHRRSEDQECREVEERGPRDSQSRREDARRDDRRDRVGRVVEPVEEVERQGNGDDGHEREVHQAYLRAMDSTVFAMSWQRSMACSMFFKMSFHFRTSIAL